MPFGEFEAIISIGTYKSHTCTLIIENKQTLATVDPESRLTSILFNSYQTFNPVNIIYTCSPATFAEPSSITREATFDSYIQCLFHHRDDYLVALAK